MMFELDVRSRKPIYEQLMNQMKDLIITEVLKENERLPSVRALAKELTISPIRLKRRLNSLKWKGLFIRFLAKAALFPHLMR